MPDDEKIIITYRVGERMPPEWTAPEQDRTEWNYRAGHHLIVMTYFNICLDELADFQRGDTHFAFAAADNVIFLLYRVGHIPWSDNPYTWHKLPDDQRAAGPPPEIADARGRALVNIVVVEGTTRTIIALRQVFLANEMSRLLHDAIRRQAATDWEGDEAHEATIARVYETCPTPVSLLAAASARCRGEDKLPAHAN